MRHGHAADAASHGIEREAHGRPYLLFWVNMVLGLAVMYMVMFSMIDGWADFRNNLNMAYMALAMGAPMGVLMLATMPGMFPSRRTNLALFLLFGALTVGSLWAVRAQTGIHDRQFIASMIPHHSGAILMCRKASLADAELMALCDVISRTQREEISQMERIAARLR